MDRLRNAFLENYHKDVPGRSDLPGPQQWPPALQKRMEELGAERFKTAGIKRDDKAAIPDDLSIIIGIALGYSDAQHPQNKFRSLRRPIQEVVRFIGF